MAPIKVKEIVRFSSQDKNHPVENLLKVQTQWNRWLCAPDDRSGFLQAELQLEKADCIGFVDIGNYGSSMVEIQVCKSYSLEGHFQTLLPATMFRTIKESREGLNKNGVRMFNREHFVEGVRDKQWDRIKIICRELSKKNQQFGLAFISFSSAENRSDKQAEKELVIKEELKTTNSKKGKIPKGSNALPAWKKNAAFYRQYVETSLKSNSGQSELKERILKMSATAEDGFTHEDSFSRSAKMLLASSGGSSKPQQLADCQVSVDADPPEEVKDGLIQFKRKLQAFIRAEGSGIATASVKGLRSKFEEQLGYQMDKEMKKEFKAASLKAAEKILSSNASSPVRTSTKQAQKKDETPGSKPVENGKTGPTKRKIFPEKPPVKAKKEKERKLPASAYRSCPRCHEKFTAGQINFHIVNCNPNHQQIARGALAAATASYDISDSPSTSKNTPSDLGKKKKTVKRKSKTQENQQRGSVKNVKVTHDKEMNSTPVRAVNLNGPLPKEYSQKSRHKSQGHDDSIVSSSPGFGKGIQEEDEDIVQCPICQTNFPSYFIEVHASSCGDW